MKDTQIECFVPGVQLLRVVACIMIAVHHLPFEIDTIETLGRGAVGIFVALSGFLIGVRCCQNDKYKNMPTIRDNVSVVKRKLKKFYWIYLIAFFLW